MKKILIAETLKPLVLSSENLLERGDMQVYTASTNDELLSVHIQEVVDLIITGLTLPGTSVQQVFDIIWQSEHLRAVSVIMVCEDTIPQKGRCARCGADSVLTETVPPEILRGKIHELLNISPRKTFRAVLNVAVEGRSKARPFLCHAENISAGGLLIRTDEDLIPGDRISCSFSLPDGRRIAANGGVTRIVSSPGGSRERLCGIAFKGLSSEAQAAIEAYVKQEQEQKRPARRRR